MRARSRRPGATRRHAVSVACVVAAVLLLLSTPSSSAPGDPVPGEDDLPVTSEVALSRGVVTTTQGTVVRRSKLFVTIKSETPIWGVFYQNLFNSPPENPTTFLALCSRGRPCLPDPFEQPACATDDLSTQQRGDYLRYRLYPVSPLASGGVDVGLLAKVRVNMVAFGSIPATARLSLRSPRVGGKIEPLEIQMWTTKNAGCDPNFVPHLHALVEGRVEITVSDLEVDGVPVDIGSSCRTVRPASLQLWNEGQAIDGGYSGGRGGNLGAYDGLHPGTLAPLDSPYYFEHRGRTIPKSTGMTIPPFTGCRANGDDLSPLLTAMASGPNNPVRVSQGEPIAPIAGIDLNNLAACNEGGQCPLPAPPTPKRPPLPEGD